MLNPAEWLGLENQGILVTGASSGIGRAVALRLASLGARVVLLGRSQERLETVRRACAGTGHRVLLLDLDGDLDGIPAKLQELAASFGPLGGLVHCAGVHQTLPLRALKVPDLERVLRINLEAGLMLAKAFRQPKVRAEAGSLVFLSSIMGRVGAPGLAAYSASKGAVEALTRSLALELAPEGIRVNSLAPGYVRTELFASLEAKLTRAQLEAIESQHPLGLGEPVQVADAVVFLLSRMSSWVTGTTLVIDGGYTAH